MSETVSLEFAIEVVLRDGPTFETIAGLCKMAVEAEREKVAAWMMGRGYATGHGDSTEDLLQELEWQIAENQPQEFVLTQTNVGIGERGMQAYEEAKKRGWVGISDE
ncbi:MAG: hypothetical protein EBR82_33205 [Caulobacteraceae bacterium]|nr:hypothetical protein [Caulobacteraceae bacterium]